MNAADGGRVPRLVRVTDRLAEAVVTNFDGTVFEENVVWLQVTCLLYTSPSPRDATLSRMPSSA